jgi:hypothetical protein
MFIPGASFRGGCSAFFRQIFPMLAVDVYKIGAVPGVCGGAAWRISSPLFPLLLPSLLLHLITLGTKKRG